VRREDVPVSAHSAQAQADRGAGEAEANATPTAAELPLLDLPELALDHMLEELSLASLTVMAYVRAALRDRCSTDTQWERHLLAQGLAPSSLSCC
jgi:hypothetical protein